MWEGEETRRVIERGIRVGLKGCVEAGAKGVILFRIECYVLYLLFYWFLYFFLIFGGLNDFVSFIIIILDVFVIFLVYFE